MAGKNSDKSRAKGRAPTRGDLLAFLETAPEGLGKREILRAFGVKGVEREQLKEMIRRLEDEGAIEKTSKRITVAGDAPALPAVTLLEAAGLDAAGEMTARPASAAALASGAPAPKIVMAPPRRTDPSLARGDRFLGRLSPLPEGSDYDYQARIVKKLGRAAERLLGVFRGGAEGGRIEPVDKRAQEEFVVEPHDVSGAVDGELVEVEARPGRRFGLRKARVIARLGDLTAPRAFSLIAMREQGIEIDFPAEAEAEAAAAEPVTALGDRLDLRETPLVTIDPSDARDHDDAVHASADPDPGNPGGHIIWVAIADVAHYVRSGSALDDAARDRGNSAYFPDRVAPMLPDRLSGDLCSLHEGVDRPCLAARLTIAADGRLIASSFHRALMRSALSLTYAEAQAAADGAPSERVAPLAGTVIAPLFAAYAALKKAREARAPLELDLPEREVRLNAAGEVEAIRFRDRFEAHKLIEECMILANVAAAEFLEKKRRRLLYRVHEEPNPTKLDALREILASVDIPLAKGQVLTTRLLNGALEAARGSENAELVNMAMLRAQTQAYYSPDNLGHFGLALRSYAHFTSPIRRYADLVVHRAILSALGWPDGQTDAEVDALAATAQHISATERRAMQAERDTIDRYLAAYLKDRAGAQFEGKIAGVQRFGLFVKLDETGADGFVPVATLGDEYFDFDEGRGRLVGRRSGVALSLGQRVRVRLVEATPTTGGMIFELLDLPDARRTRGARGKPAPAAEGAKPRRPAKGRIAAAKAARGARKS